MVMSLFFSQCTPGNVCRSSTRCSDRFSFPIRNLGLHQWGKKPSLLPVLLPRGEVAGPRKQALGEETHHRGGEVPLNYSNALMDLNAVFQCYCLISSD